MKRFLVVYDIPSDKKANKRRKKLYDLLCGHGVGVNDSVFELTLTHTAHRKLTQSIQNIIDKKHDSVRIYPLCLNCTAAIEAYGENDLVPFLLADTYI